jgi:hypothetical protein
MLVCLAGLGDGRSWSVSALPGPGRPTCNAISLRSTAGPTTMKTS